jgi:hydroxymethylpyrimidine pyrophosphatase-like HAD family hydrolase
MVTPEECDISTVPARTPRLIATDLDSRGLSGADVWAFGDMPSDVPMLAWAGVSFAVANAHPDVVAAASRCCPSNADDGVASVLESLLGRMSET